jgi:hypothetical protein
MARIAVFFTALLLIACNAIASAETDAIESKLIDAKKQYYAALENVRISVHEALERKLTASKKVGDLKAVEAIQSEIDIFEQSGKMPQSIPTKGFDSQVKLARKRMEDAFADSIRQYTKDDKIELAKAIRKELDQFKATTPTLAANPKDPFQPKSVWVGDQGQVLTVTERRGEAFRANFKIGGNIERDVSGNIQKDKISWLAKNVRLIKGRAGGDNHGTIVAENMNYKIDFVWRDESGASGTFTLRLSKPR